ncbi:hypothetical protein MMC16_006226 [Acarospora aff. strigata]|nr:hypothetical protein [Acarospora aff. strigata]
MLDQSGRELDESIRRDVTNYKKVLVDEYKLCRLPEKPGVSSVDPYHVLFYHWMRDDAVFRDKQQRSYVPAGILMASYFGCRPVSMVDTRLQFEDENVARKPADHAAAASRPRNGGEDQEARDTDKNMDWEDDRATLINSDYDLDVNDNASTYYDSDSDSGTDDGVDAGLLARLDREAVTKTFIVEREDNPLLCLLNHLLSIALYDDVFAAESLRNVSNIVRAKTPSGNKCLQLKMKIVLDTPVFHEPGGGVDGYRTSPTEPLQSGTWLDKAPSSVRDQIFDDHFNAVRYYLDREVRFNTQAAFLGRPSDDVVQKLARPMMLAVNPNGPNKLSEELSKKLADSKRVVRFGRTGKALTENLKKKYGLVQLAPPNDPCLMANEQADVALHHGETTVGIGCSKRPGRDNSETPTRLPWRLQFADPSIAASDKDVEPPAPLDYNIREQVDIVRLTCEPIANLTDHEKHARRIEAFRAWVALCGRQESRCRGRPRPVQ